MSPLTAMMSAPTFCASSRIVSLSTITPRSCTSNPLQVSTIPVIFFPISCTSPFTVANTTFSRLPAVIFSALSIYGDKISTASLITLAALTTCGRNILPSPKSLPTASIPSIRGPSIIATAVPYSASASWISASSVSVLPLSRAF